MPLKCSECSKEFTIKSNLTRHLRMIHCVEVERVDIQPGDFEVYHYKCLEGCNISFKYNRELRKHLTEQHNMSMVELSLEFPNADEFKKWLHKEEVDNCIQYVHLTATKRKTTGTETYYYECSRTGRRSYVDDNLRKRRARKLITKLNRGCTSQIIVNRTHNGVHMINYFKSHYGHEISVEHVKLSKQDRGAIASKLMLGLPVSSVLHSVKQSSGNVKRINLLARKDIVNIRKSFNIYMKDGKLVNPDSININLFLNECSSLEFKPILYCNIQDFSKSYDDISLILMTKYQSEILKEAGENIIALNSTSLNNCDFELITLFVIGQTHQSFPAACMFTDKVHRGAYELFFNKIRERVGCIKPNIFITHCEEIYYEAWKNVMGEVPHHLYNPVQIELDWKLNLNRIVCNETDVTKIKRKWVYDSLKILESNSDVNDFLESMEDTMKVLDSDEDFKDFIEYFSKNYSDPKTWASYYRKHLKLPLKQLEVTHDLLRHYLNEDIETRFDVIFHSLIRFIRDETVNYMLKNKKNRVFFINESDNRHASLEAKSLSGNHLNDNLWNVVEENGATHVVQKYLESKCCNLICSTCYICIHCFSCSCVDFFISNAICVHIHYIWLTYFQSIVETDDCSEIKTDSCEEEIIIEVDEDPDQTKEDVEVLKTEIVKKTTILSSSINNVENSAALKVILDTVNRLCDLCDVGEDLSSTEQKITCEKNLGDHSYVTL